MARQRPPDRLDQILRAATRVFARTGLDASKMSDVAEEAGVSQGTLYNYVESKEALFRLLLDRGLGAPAPTPAAFPLRSPAMGALARRMDEAIEAAFALPRLDEALARRRVTDAAAELAGVLGELFERTHATREAADVLERSARDVPELAAVFYGKVRRGLFDKVTTLIERRMDSGHYHRRNPHVVARLLVEAITTFARHIYRDVEPPAFDLGEARADVVSALVAGVVAPAPRRSRR
jgi:AcrR family transcriptional regulator